MLHIDARTLDGAMVMRRFREWMHREIVDATEPRMVSTSEELRHAIEDATAAMHQAVHVEASATHAAIVELRQEYERVTTELSAALDRIGDELDASHATNRALLARLRALDAKAAWPPAHVVGGTIDAQPTDADLPDIDLAALDAATRSERS